MPRFLDTYTGQFVWLADVGTTPYAILSHTWRSDTDGGEQTYDDILKLQSAYPPSTQSQQNVYPPPLNEPFFSHPGLSEKIRGICAVARKAGYRLIWIDSCCIDKRSSAELTEAINSMYSLYRDANVCYVYLADVPDGTDPRDTGDDSPFKNSRWHKRGWTLQELIAPARVVFLSRHWTFLGTKTSLASTLEAITRVDVAILTGMAPLDSASVAKRMSWAARRETTRVEDRAYSLLGIFEVHMSPIYGEGTNAFLRLQEEIIKHIPDQSVFAWGTSRNPFWHFRPMRRGPLVLSEVGLGLLATSPDVFEDVGDVTPIPASAFATYIGRDHDFVLPPLHCVFTPQGVRIGLIHIPLTALHDTVRVLHKAPMGSFSSVDEEVEVPLPPIRSLAILRCQDEEGNLIVLPLRYVENDVGRAENVVVGAHWHVMCPFKQWHLSTRVIRLPPDVLKAPDVVATSTCADTSILRHYEEPRAPKTHRDGFSKAGWTDPRRPGKGKQAVVRFAPECVEELRTLGFALAPLDCQCSQEDIVLTTTLYCAPRDPLRDYEMKRGPSARIHFRLSGMISTAHFAISYRGDLPVVNSLPNPALQTPNGDLAELPRYECIQEVSNDGESDCRDKDDSANHSSDDDDDEYQLGGTHEVRDINFSSSVVAEAEFMTPRREEGSRRRPARWRHGVRGRKRRHAAHASPVDHPSGDEGSRPDLVRLVRLKLERPPQSAYIEDRTNFLFSVELSEAFKPAQKTRAPAEDHLDLDPAYPPRVYSIDTQASSAASLAIDDVSPPHATQRCFRPILTRLLQCYPLKWLSARTRSCAICATELWPSRPDILQPVHKSQPRPEEWDFYELLRF